MYLLSMIFFFYDTATTEIYTLSLHDALPICHNKGQIFRFHCRSFPFESLQKLTPVHCDCSFSLSVDRKSTRLNSSHANISYAVFCLKKKNKKNCILTNNMITNFSVSMIIRLH